MENRVTFDYSKAAPFINEDELNLMEAQVAAAKKLLVDRSGAGTYHTGGAEGIPIVTVQYLHSYEQKSNENRLWRWDFCVQPSGFWHIHA